MKLDISMALPSLRKQPLNLQGMGGSAFIGLPKNMLCVQRRQSQQGDKVCKRSHILCSKERASEIVLASSQQAYNIQKIDVFELPTLQQPVQVEEMRSDPILKNETEVLLSHYIPVFVMLPLDVISNDNTLQNKDLLKENLKALKSANVDGLMVDVWWGIVEAEGPKQYDWSAYRDLFKLLQEQGFKLQAIMSFHQCGGNTGDDITIPLPKWVLETAESNPNLFFTNKDGQCNKECLTYGVDDKPVLLGRTAVEIYSHYMKSFRENMSDFLDSRFITDIEVGLGPAGELRYPSYSKSQGWKFPGIGEFQCYDEYLLSDLKAAALSIGRPEWAFSTPDNAGNYNDEPNSTDFFRDHGSYTTESGKFFLTWYSNMLLRHGDKILEAASKIFEGCSTKLAAKVAGIHWWYKSSSHAAELTAGYYNLDERDGYRPIARMLARHRAVLNFTCIEMQDEEHPSEASCGPEALVKQVLNAGWKEGIEVSCENALPRYDRDGYEQMIRQARPDGINRGGRPLRRICALTYLRLSNMLMQENPCKEFKRFVQGLHVGLDYHPEPEKYFNPRGPLQRSKPRQETREFLDEAVPLEPFSDGAYASFNLDAFRTDKEESEKDEGSFIDWILRRLLSWYQDKN